MNDTPNAPFAFVPAQPKGQAASANAENAKPAGQQETDRPRRTRRTKAELAAVQGEKQIDPFDVFDKVYAMLDPLPKSVRDRIMSTLNKIYG